MKLSQVSTRNIFFVDILKTIDSQPFGYALTKNELAAKFGFKSHMTVDKWCRIFPEIKTRAVYVKCNNGANRQTVFVSKKHKKKILEAGLATETYHGNFK